jgi:hypothetical protein
MTATLPEATEWAAIVGARLRLLQASFAEDDTQERRQYLEEEIELGLRDVPAGRRPAYLEALAERFPAGLGVDLPPEAMPGDEAAAEGLRTPEAVVAELRVLAGTLSDQRRRELASDLQDAGFILSVMVQAAAAPAAPEADEVPVELQKKLGLEPNQVLDRKRAIRLVGVLIDLVVTMDQVGWQVWRDLAPTSRVRKEPGNAGDLRKLAGPFLLGDPEVSTAQIVQLLDKTRQLIVGLVAAIGSAGETFARQYMSRFSPQSIKVAADEEPGFFIGPEQKCWRKYIELFNEVSGVTIENEITNAIVQRTEQLILGGSKGPSSSRS